MRLTMGTSSRQLRTSSNALSRTTPARPSGVISAHSLYRRPRRARGHTVTTDDLVDLMDVVVAGGGRLQPGGPPGTPTVVGCLMDSPSVEGWTSLTRPVAARFASSRQLARAGFTAGRCRAAARRDPGAGRRARRLDLLPRSTGRFERFSARSLHVTARARRNTAGRCAEMRA